MYFQASVGYLSFAEAVAWGVALSSRYQYFSIMVELVVSPEQQDFLPCNHRNHTWIGQSVGKLDKLIVRINTSRRTSVGYFLP